MMSIRHILRPLLLVLLGGPAFSAARHPLEQDLKQFSERLAEEKKQLRRLLQNSSAILSLLGDLEREISELDRAEEELRGRLAEQQRQLELCGEYRQELESRLGSARRRLALWLRQHYKARRPFVETLGGGERLAAFLQKLRWETGAAHRQIELIQRITDLRRELETEKLRIEHLAAEERQALEQLGRRQRELQDARRKRLAMLQLVRGQASLHKRALSEMERARSRVVELLQQLEGQPGAGRGFATWQGRLPPPVSGARIDVPFGLLRDETFHTRIPHPGVDVRAEPASPVRTVYPGTVVFAGWMDGYGLMAIVDHGGGYFTLYAHLQNLAVKRGDKVAAEAELGRMGDTGSIKGPYLYFEVREKGRAVDPQLWVRW